MAHFPPACLKLSMVAESRRLAGARILPDRRRGGRAPLWPKNGSGGHLAARGRNLLGPRRRDLPRPGKLRSPQAATGGQLVGHAKSSAPTRLNTTAPMPGSLACLLTPHGALRLEAAQDDTALDASVAERLEAAFRKGDGHGLLQLGLAEAGSRLPPDLAFWRAFAMRFVAAVCTAGENAVEAVYPPAPGEEALKTLVEEAPPMRGGEYLDAGRLAALWEALAQAFEAERSESGLSVGAFLAAPRQPLAARRARPFQPRREPQGRRASVRLSGDLRLLARRARRAASCPARRTPCANTPGRARTASS